jgi:preprotein translocase subunit SecY
LLFPSTILNLVGQASLPAGPIQDIVMVLNKIFNPSGITYYAIYFLMIVALTFFYASIMPNMQPKEIADNLKKYGSSIPGIKPGKETARYLSMILNRVTFIGAAFITIIGILPFIVQIVLNNIYPTASQTLAAGFGGTGIIIIVGVALETVKEIEGRMAGKDYSGFSAELD